MVGSYNIEVVSSNIKYNINIKYSISIIKGFSGLGKSYFYKLLLAMQHGTSTVKCNMADKIIVLTHETSWGTLIPSSHGKIFIADENIPYIYLSDFAEVAQTSDNYFIFITRQSLNCFTYSSDAIYTLEEINNKGRYENININLYSDNQLDNYKPDLILCEDKKSGYYMFKELFNIDVESACGKDNIAEYIKNNTKYKRIYVIADETGFGSCVNEILKLNKGNYTEFYLFLPRSFEYMLLKYHNYRIHLKDQLDNTENYCDTLIYKSWERYYTKLMEDIALKYNFKYTKSKLSPKLKFDKMYDNIKSQIKDIDKEVFK